MEKILLLCLLVGIIGVLAELSTAAQPRQYRGAAVLSSDPAFVSND